MVEGAPPVNDNFLANTTFKQSLCRSTSSWFYSKLTVRTCMAFRSPNSASQRLCKAPPLLPSLASSMLAPSARGLMRLSASPCIHGSRPKQTDTAEEGGGGG